VHAVGGVETKNVQPVTKHRAHATREDEARSAQLVAVHEYRERRGAAGVTGVVPGVHERSRGLEVVTQQVWRTRIRRTLHDRRELRELLDQLLLRRVRQSIELRCLYAKGAGIDACLAEDAHHPRVR